MACGCGSANCASFSSCGSGNGAPTSAVEAALYRPASTDGGCGTHPCGGSSAPVGEVCPDGTLLGSTLVVVGPCGTPFGPANTPPPKACYPTTLGVRLQGVVDRVRQIPAQLGLAPYQVAIVWVRRDHLQVFVEFRRLVLSPVRISGLRDMTLSVTAVGRASVGGVVVSGVSPNQVDESVLSGRIGGVPLAQNEDYFFEVTRTHRCVGDRPETLRFALSGLPEFRPDEFDWTFGLIDSEAARGSSGEDQTHLAADETLTTKLGRLRTS